MIRKKTCPNIKLKPIDISFSPYFSDKKVYPLPLRPNLQFTKITKNLQNPMHSLNTEEARKVKGQIISNSTRRNEAFARKLISMTISEDERISTKEFTSDSVRIKKKDPKKFKNMLNEIISQNIKLKAINPYVHDHKNEKVFFHPESLEFAEDLLPRSKVLKKYHLNTNSLKKNNLFLEYTILSRMEEKENKKAFYSVFN